MEYMEKKFIKLKEQAPELSENDLYKFQFLLVRLKKGGAKNTRKKHTEKQQLN